MPVAGGKSAGVTMAPIMQLQELRFAPLGLMNMLNPGGAVLSCQLGPASSSAPERPGPEDEVSSSGDLVAAQLSVQGNGSLLLYSSQRPRDVLVEGLPRDWQHKAESGALTVQLDAGESVHKQVQVIW